MARATLSPFIKAQVEKLTSGAVSSARRPVSISSPIAIPKKPPRSNASSQSSSSYTSVADQMSFQSESSTPFRRELDDGGNSSLPTLPSTGEQLAHTAARDRISVKNRRRQPANQKLSTLRETEDSEASLFPRTATTTTAEATPSTPEEEQPITVATRTEAKLQQPLIDLSDLQTTRARLRLSVRTRDRSADTLLLATTTTNPTMIADTPAASPGLSPKLISPMQRSVSLKRPKENTDPKPISRPFVHLKSVEKVKVDPTIENDRTWTDQAVHHDEVSEPVIENSVTTTQSISRSSSQEHIYDNLDVFKRALPKVLPPLVADHESPLIEVKSRERPRTPVRPRPVTMHAGGSEGSDSTTEFENAFNQLKKRGSIRRVRPQDEKPPTPPPPFVVTDEAPTSVVDPVVENEVPVVIAKPIETTPITPSANRRKIPSATLLSSNDKVGTSEPKPAPSWIDIAKQKQTKFQTISNEKLNEGESEEQALIESPAVVRKSLVSADVRPNRKSMYESSTNTTSKTQQFERDSIRALKTENPNRINSLIQFFDK